MKTIDFATISLQDALDFAILIEEEAAERYQELVDQMEAHHTAGAASFFRFMVENETKHGNELSARRRSLFGDAPRNVDRSEIWEVEAPGYEKGRAFMSAGQALQVALESEQKAHDFFVAAIPHIGDASARAVRGTPERGTRAPETREARDGETPGRSGRRHGRLRRRTGRPVAAGPLGIHRRGAKVLFAVTSVFRHA